MIIYLLSLHYIADFLLQSREMGQKKSSEFTWLLKHLLIQFYVVFIGMLYPLGITRSFILAVSNTVIHGIIDWYIWKGYKYSVYLWMKNNPDHIDTITYRTTKVWRYWDDHVFYSTIGLDQLLHVSTLITLMWFI